MDGRYYAIIPIAFLSLLFCGLASGATYTCNSCSDCSSKINSSSSGDVVYLTTNISLSESESCILFKYTSFSDVCANGVTFDCRGNRIDGPSEREGYSGVYGVQLQDCEGATVKNCKISSFDRGIAAYSSNNMEIINNTLSDNTYRNGLGSTTGIGLYVSGSNNTIMNNSASGNLYGFYISGQDNVLTRNTVEDNTGYSTQGIYIYYGSRNELNENIVNNNAGDGIYLFYSDNNNLRNNTVTENSDGIYLDYADNNTVRNNTVNNNGGSGVYLFRSDNTTVSENIIKNNWNSGISAASDNNTLTGNNVENNSYGIYVSGENNTLTGNIAYNNSDAGIELYYLSINNILRSNSITKFTGQKGFHTTINSIAKTIHYRNDIDTSNTINGLPIQYYDGVYKACPNGQTLSFDLSSQTVSHLQLVGCDNVIVRNLDSSDLDGIYLVFTSNSKVENCISSRNEYGIASWFSNSNTITDNTANDNSMSGLYIYVSNKSTVSQNTVTGNLYGIAVVSSANNTITQNTANSNDKGIQITSSNDNTFTSNNVCYSTNYDFSIYIYEPSINSGDYNTCDKPYTWDDDGTNGCTYACGAATTTSSTSTTSTSTTIQGECTLVGDEPPCGTVTLSEVIDAINSWSQGGTGLADVIALINAWAG